MPAMRGGNKGVKKRFLMVIEDLEPRIEGPYVDELARMSAAMDHKDNNMDTEVYGIDVTGLSDNGEFETFPFSTFCSSNGDDNITDQE